LHFLLLALSVMALSEVLGTGTDAQQVITINETVTRELERLFVEGQDRKPTPAEMDALVYRWAQNEVLYREALALGLDKGDEMIRERIVTKLRQSLIDRIVIDKPDAATLERWFAENGAAFNRPALVDFEILPMPGETEAMETAAGEPTAAQIERRLRYDARTEQNLVQVFGEAFAKALMAQQPGAWIPLQSSQGWHLVRVLAQRPPAEVSLEEVRQHAEKVWMDVEKKREMGRTIDEIRSRYEMKLRLPEPTA
jgi:hypothetical protein